jgi:hypothetical protein
MTQEELNRAVAMATGESMREIRRRGFGLGHRIDRELRREIDRTLPQFIDWDELDINLSRSFR